MPVSMKKFRRAMTPRRTATEVGRMCSILEAVAARTEYEPGKRRTRYRPVELVTIDVTGRP
jgi:hypothetical protein